jgi:hypothetical protein
MRQFEGNFPYNATSIPDDIKILIGALIEKMYFPLSLVYVLLSCLLYPYECQMKAISEDLSLLIARSAIKYPKRDVLVVVTMAITVFWGISPCGSETVRRFVVIYRKHLVAKYCWFHDWCTLQH